MGSKKSGKKKKKKSPVLTSPWKIGMFVALMLLVTGSGVGYYFVRMYDIGLTWLGPDKSRWIVDSYAFFKETYPLAAGVIVMSLLTYFLIASAVRRYRYYLDSGQDYRRMVSLAESIDDLTNPAQIARLSDYPELQDVLRNYGDQIREISAEINERQDENRSVDLEMEIDSILKGNPVSDSLIDGKWWAPVARKVETALRERAPSASGDDRVASDRIRRAVSRAALACGRIMESACGVSEEIARIADEAGELAAASRGGTGQAPVDTGASAPAGGIVEQVRHLDQVRATLNGFSEQNNGLALNIALMAARGNVDEQQLAQYAEKVRMTAERFGALGRDLEGISHGIAETSRALSSPAPAAGGSDPALSTKALGIEHRSRILMERIASLVEDAEEIASAIRSAGGETVQETPSEHPESEAAPAVDEGSLRLESTGGDVEERMIVNFGSGSGISEDARPGDDLVIDHGGMWTGPGGTEEQAHGEPEPAAHDVQADASGGEGSLKISGLAESLAAEHAAAQSRAAESPARSAAAPVDEQAGPDSAPDGTGEWMEMPGRRWVKVDAERERVAGRETAQDASPPAEGNGDTVGSPDHGAADQTDSGEEPVYDLAELGAVECLEETEATM